jgi:hypothetical protein
MKETRNLRRRIGKYMLCTIAIMMSIYVGMFCWHFELVGMPVINRERGWLGPWIRDTKQTQDIGGVGYYESTDYRLYDFYRPLCRAWIWANGLPYGEFRS